MNKKIVIGIIILVVIIAGFFGYRAISNNSKNVENVLVADNKNETSDKEEFAKPKENAVSNEVIEEVDEQDKELKILIAYFSRANENYNVGDVEVGNTEIMAGFIKDFYGDKADEFKIVPVKEYPLEYEACVNFAKYEQEKNARPEFKEEVDISKYDVIFLGYPIWCGDVPMIINTFLEKYDFTGKKIELFNTHEGSGNSGTYSYISKKLKNADVNTNGLPLRGSLAREEKSRVTVEDWLRGLDY